MALHIKNGTLLIEGYQVALWQGIALVTTGLSHSFYVAIPEDSCVGD
jgi:hypothetical protein